MERMCKCPWPPKFVARVRDAIPANTADLEKMIARGPGIVGEKHRRGGGRYVTTLLSIIWSAYYESDWHVCLDGMLRALNEGRAQEYADEQAARRDRQTLLRELIAIGEKIASPHQHGTCSQMRRAKRDYFRVLNTPLASTDLDSDIVDAFADWGVTTIGDLLVKPSDIQTYREDPRTFRRFDETHDIRRPSLPLMLGSSDKWDWGYDTELCSMLREMVFRPHLWPVHYKDHWFEEWEGKKSPK